MKTIKGVIRDTLDNGLIDQFIIKQKEILNQELENRVIDKDIFNGICLFRLAGEPIHIHMTVLSSVLDEDTNKQERFTHLSEFLNTQTNNHNPISQKAVELIINSDYFKDERRKDETITHKKTAKATAKQK